jgi:3-deoxy-alpha-D-manno-octulosonate 8-oxidase
MMDRQGIELPRGLMEGVAEERISKMIDAALFLEPLWEHAFGTDWRQIMTREKIRELYLRM